MALTFRKLHPHFVGESSPVELRKTHDEETLARIRAGMDEFAVLVFHDQSFSDAEQIAFGERLDGRLHQGLLLRDLMEHATQTEFVYRHAWRVGDLVIWDNRATMHRARPFDDAKYRRELRRVTTLDIEQPAFDAAGS